MGEFWLVETEPGPVLCYRGKVLEERAGKGGRLCLGTSLFWELGTRALWTWLNWACIGPAILDPLLPTLPPLMCGKDRMGGSGRKDAWPMCVLFPLLMFRCLLPALHPGHLLLFQACPDITLGQMSHPDLSHGTQTDVLGHTVPIGDRLSLLLWQTHCPTF